MPISYSGPEIMEMAVETERGGKHFYQQVAAGSKHKELKGLFEFLADEEDKHVTAFQNIARQVKESPQDLAYNWEEAAQYLDAIIHSRYFLGKGKALSLVSEADTPARAIDCALGFEKETLLFYTEVLAMVGEVTKPAVRRLIAEEKNHIARLSSIRSSL